MATGRSNKIVGQTGEYLVAAELSRRGLIATTFTGNVPHYDIIASNEFGKHVSVQVKAAVNPSWQFDITKYCDIAFKGRQQIIGRKKPCPVKDLIFIFVKVNRLGCGGDSFYVLPWRRLRDLLVRHHKRYLSKYNGIRPQKWDSFHCAITEKILTPYLDKWETVLESLR